MVDEKKKKREMSWGGGFIYGREEALVILTDVNRGVSDRYEALLLAFSEA